MVNYYLVKKDKQLQDQYYTFIFCLNKLLPRKVVTIISSVFRESALSMVVDIYEGICRDHRWLHRPRDNHLDYELVESYIERFVRDERGDGHGTQLHKTMKKERKVVVHKWRWNDPVVLVPVDPKIRRSNTRYKQPYVDRRHQTMLKQRYDGVK